MKKESFIQTVARLAKEIDASMKPGQATRIKEDFDLEYRPHVIKFLVEKYFYVEEIPYHLRKPALKLKHYFITSN
jgi:hypothetical protein